MSNYNHCVLVGRVGRDPEVKEIGDKKTAKLELAVATNSYNAQTKKSDLTSWHRIVSFRENVINFAEKYIKKGNVVLVEGEYRTRTYEKDGSKVTMAELYANEVKLIGGRSNGEGNSGDESRASGGSQSTRRSSAGAQPPSRRQAAPPAPAVDDVNDDDNDIPF